MSLGRVIFESCHAALLLDLKERYVMTQITRTRGKSGNVTQGP